MTTAPTTEDLAQLEARVRAALDSGDYSSLRIIGFGEISVGFGWPDSEPAWICKRSPAFTAAEFASYRDLVTSYVAELRVTGIDVVETDVLGVRRAKDTIGYLVQPLLPQETLGREVLRRSEPDAEHPFILAVAETVGYASAQLSIDAQITNFSWDGTTATLLDVGTPFMWQPNGELRLDLVPFTKTIPAPLRSMLRSEIVDVVERWKQSRGVGADIVANLLREGLDDWVEPMIDALTAVIPGDRITRAEAQALLDEDLKTFPRIAKLKKVQRAFRTRVQRKPYDFFVNSTYDGDSLS